MRANLMIVAALFLVGCGPTVNVKVEPIHATVDVNVRVDRDLDQFFDYRDKGGSSSLYLPAENHAAL